MHLLYFTCSISSGVGTVSWLQKESDQSFSRMDDAICYVQQGCQIHKSGGYLAVALQLRFDCRRVNPYQRILEYQFRLELSTVMPIICLGLRLSIGRDYRHQVFFRFALSARPQPQLTTSTRTQDRRHRRWPVAQYPQSPTSRACAYALALSWQPCVPKNIKYASCLTSNPERFTSNFQAPS